MGEYIKHGFIFAILCAVALLMLNILALGGVEAAAAISSVVLIPLSWFWDLLGIPACQIMGYIVFIIPLVLIYYLAIGFTVGFLLSVLIETILARKEHKHYSKQSPKDLNNGSPGCSAAEPGVEGSP